MNCFKVSSSKTGVRTLDQCFLSSGVFVCTEFLGEYETECGILKIYFHWIELLYSVVLVSSLRQVDQPLNIGIHMSPLFFAFPCFSMFSFALDIS